VKDRQSVTKIGLRSRLFFSHLLVMFVGVGSFVLISSISAPRYFVLHLEALEGTGFRLRYARSQLVKGFERALDRGTVWSVIVGGTAAAGLSYWVSKRIVQPLTQMEQITQRFAAGNLQERVPTHEIPELDQLGASFNRMAASIEGVEQRRRELVSDLTHELRTPLTIVRGYLEELVDGGVEPTPEIYQRLIQETRRLERLVNDLQELSKAEAGYLPVNAQPLPLRPLLESLVIKFADQVLEDGPVFQLDCPTTLPLVMADGERVEQILINLLGNALRYTPQGSITLRVWPQARQLWIAVVDTGHGIAPEDLPHVFERFWRADQSRSRRSGGTGLGLAICQRLVELQGGQIEAESQLGQGSTFRFCLPMA
jgi:signal transduction histidine kinase